MPAESLRPEPLLTGKDLIAMGYTPGPPFKGALQALEDAQLDGTVTTREDACTLISKTLSPLV